MKRPLAATPVALLWIKVGKGFVPSVLARPIEGSGSLFAGVFVQ